MGNVEYRSNCPSMARPESCVWHLASGFTSAAGHGEAKYQEYLSFSTEHLSCLDLLSAGDQSRGPLDLESRTFEIHLYVGSLKLTRRGELRTARARGTNCIKQDSIFITFIQVIISSKVLLNSIYRPNVRRNENERPERGSTKVDCGDT